MKLEDQVISLECAKRLTGLGVKHKSLFYWRANYAKDSFEVVYIPDENAEPYLPAYTVAELGEMLPETVGAGKARKYPSDRKFYFCTYYIDDYKANCEASTETDARAEMLIYLLENKLITL